MKKLTLGLPPSPSITDRFGGNNLLSDISAESLNWNIRDDLKGLSYEKIKDNQIKLPYAIATFNIDGSLNIGVMIRTAVIFGASDFYIFGKRKYDKRSTVGAHNYINIIRTEYEDYWQLIQKLEEKSYFPVFIEQGYPVLDDVAMSLFNTMSKMNHPRIPCFVFGSESDGIPEEILKENNFKYSLKQYGVLRSLNVSAAASIVMHKYVELINN